jgi:glycosyltransferase involved in cell wall biosynthesis
MITTQILTKNNEKTIEETLASIKKLDTEIVIADLGSTDNTLSICKKYKARIWNVDFHNNYSEIRNSIVKNSKNNWHFFIHPWEILEDYCFQEKTNTSFMILKENIITKEIRFWEKGSTYFVNPIYETLTGPSKTVNSMIYSNSNYHLGMSQEILSEWKTKNPFNNKPDYYFACDCLTRQQYDDFIRLAKHFLFVNKTEENNVIMIRYYLAMVYCYIKRNAVEAINNIMVCIAKYPLMAEFWCLLGDIYVHLKDFVRAKSFYENALILGKSRDLADSMPIEISKYDDYPNKMIKLLES